MYIERKKRKIKLYFLQLILNSCSTIGIAFEYFYKYIYKVPCKTSTQIGVVRMKEILNENPIESVNAFRMHPSVFMKLTQEPELNGLKSSDKMLTVEKLGILIHIHTCNRFV